MLIKLRQLIIFICLIISSQWVLLAQINVSAFVNQSTVYEDEKIFLSIKVENGQGNEKFNFPKQDYFKVSRAGQSTQHTIINGKSSRAITYEFVLTPLKAGAYQFGSIVVIHENQTFQTNGFSGRILKAKERKNEFKEDLFVELLIDKEKFYIDEPVTLRFRIYSKFNFSLYDARYELPKLTDFISEEETKDVYEKVVNGIGYKVNEIRTILYPTRKGTFEIGAATLFGYILKKDKTSRRKRSSRFDFDSFFMDPFSDDPFFGSNVKKVPVRLASKSLKVNILPLPESGKPSDFSGTVGNYRLKVNYSDVNNLKQGDAITLTVEVQGTGHLDTIEEPVVFASEAFKAFEPEIQIIPLAKDQKVAGKKIFKKIIIPIKAGTLKLPDVSFNYFDPYQEKYVSLMEKGKEIIVEKVEGKDFSDNVFDYKPQNKVTKKELKITGRDILYLNTNLGILKKTQSAISGAFFNILLAGGFIFNIFLLFLTYIYQSYMSDPVVKRRRKAMKGFKSQIVKVNKEFKKDNKEAFSSLSKAVSKYLSDKTNLNIGTWTSLEIDEKLKERKLSLEVINNLKKHIEILDMGQYGMKSMEKKEWSAFLKEIITTVHEIDKHGIWKIQK